jgi:molybdopterin synthase catalytic subunit
MNVRVRLFAGLADAAGFRTSSLELPPGATAAAGRDALGDRYPALRSLCTRVALAVNAEYVDGDHHLADGDELALIPPVSGG